MCIYTSLGGLKATFLSSYIHTIIIYVALCIFAFTVYATGPDLGQSQEGEGCRNPGSSLELCLQAAPVAPLAIEGGGSRTEHTAAAQMFCCQQQECTQQ